MKKLEITYISHRGGPGYENIYPEKHCIPYEHFRCLPPVESLEQAVADLQKYGGFYYHSGRNITKWVPFHMIIDFVERSS